MFGRKDELQPRTYHVKSFCRKRSYSVFKFMKVMAFIAVLMSILAITALSLAKVI